MTTELYDSDEGEMAANDRSQEDYEFDTRKLKLDLGLKSDAVPKPKLEFNQIFGKVKNAAF